MDPHKPTEKDERYVMGQWFESVAGAVQAYPFRAGTEAAKILHYDRTTVSALSRAFNAKSKNRAIPSLLEQASAGRHLYKISTAPGEDPAAADHLLEKMKALYTVCKKNGVGVVVHTPEPGLVQINLTPQQRPEFTPKPRPRKMTLRM